MDLVSDTSVTVAVSIYNRPHALSLVLKRTQAVVSQLN